MDWIGGLDWWTGLVNWTSPWTGLMDWTDGLDWWTAVVLYLPGNTLKLKVAVWARLVRRKEHGIVLYLIGLLTIIHLSIMVYSMLYYGVIKAEQFTRYQTSSVVIRTQVRLSPL